LENFSYSIAPPKYIPKNPKVKKKYFFIFYLLFWLWGV